MVDPINGQVNTTTTSVGNHFITYVPPAGSCSDSITIPFTITSSGSTTFYYPTNSVCSGSAASTYLPVVQPANGSFFSSTLSLGAVNFSTGEITTALVPAGTHTIVYTPHPDSCATQDSTTFTIGAPTAANFYYLDSIVCFGSSISSVLPTVRPTNGSFSSPTLSGSILDSNTGVINAGLAPVGTHVITYDPHPDSCAIQATDTFIIQPSQVTQFSYPSNSACQTSSVFSLITPSIVQPLGGVFSSATLNANLNVNTGQINTNNAPIGTHIITYSPDPDSCASALSISFTIDPSINTTFFYPDSIACSGASPFPYVPTVQPTGGIFSSATLGSNILDPNTGVINTAVGPVDTHTVVYTPNPNSCASQATATFEFRPTVNSIFYYTSTSACQTSNGPNWTNLAVVQPSGGTFSTTSMGLDLNQNTGQINTNNAPVGQHSILYTPHPDSCANPAPALFVIDPAGPATFFYTPDSACETTTSIFSSAPNTGGLIGTFTSNDPNLVMNATGSIDLGSTPPGTYTITFHPVGSSCADSASAFFTVLPLDDASFSYPGTDFCLGEGNPVATAVNPGGNYSSPGISGVAIADPLTGEIDIAASLANGAPYLIQYMTSGTCPASDLVSVSLNDTSAFFQMPDTICKSMGGVLEATGIVGRGNFLLSVGLQASSPTATNNMASDTSVGLINVAGSGSGTHTVTYTLDPSGNCQDSYVHTLEVLPQLAYNGQYSDTIICLGGPNAYLDSVAPGPGYFSYRPVPPNPTQNLSINPSSGAINPGIGWSDPGRYEVIFIDTDGPCFDTLHIQYINVQGVGSASLAYGSTEYCASDSNPLPSSFGPLGGNFIGSNGLAINDTTGEINLAASSSNVLHTVTYRSGVGSCQDSAFVYVTVLEYLADFHYGADTFCIMPGGYLPIFNSHIGPSGIYSADPAGLAIDSITGEINPMLSSTGNYVVQFSMDSTCSAVFEANDSIRIELALSATFIYSSDSICLNATNNPIPVPAEPGGVYSVLSGACIIDSVTGEIFLDSSSAGSCLIEYTLPGDCSISDSNNIVLVDPANSTFYYTQDTFCTTGGSAVPVVDSNFTFGYSWTVLQGVGLNIDPSTGVIDLGISLPDTFVVAYYTAQEQCPTTTLDTFEILNGQAPHFSYTDTVFCNTSGTASVLMGTLNSTNGYFSSSTNLVIDPLSGDVDLANSTPGTHTVTFTVTSGIVCPQQQTSTIEIVAYDNSTSFVYPQDTFCKGDLSITPTIFGDTSGVFSMAVQPPPIDSGSGMVDFANLTAGDYTVTYSLNGICQEIYSENFHLLDDEDPSFSYSSNTYCPNDGNQLPQSIATPGGTFSADNGLVVGPVTGQLFLASANDSLGWIGNVYYTTPGRCQAMDSVELVIYPEVPSLEWDADPSTSICVGTNVVFETSFALLNQFVINGTPEGGNSDTYESDQFENGDLVQMVHSNDAICWDTVSVTMDVNDFPILTITDYTETAISGEPIYVHLQSNTEGTRFEWTSYSLEGVVTEPDSGALNASPIDWSAVLDPVVVSPYDQYPTSVDIYIQTSAFGCEGDPDTVTIRINPEGVAIFVPELVTPNGDGFNDTWRIQWNHEIDPYNYTMSLYNRSYGLVREISPLHPDWDAGTLPDGIYKWILRDQSGAVQRSGGLTIRRK